MSHTPQAELIRFLPRYEYKPKIWEDHIKTFNKHFPEAIITGFDPSFGIRAKEVDNTSFSMPVWFMLLMLEKLNSHYELLAALKEACSRCGCGGTGIDYTMEDETEIGQAPGSSAIDCPECAGWRAAITKAEPPGAGNPGG